MACHKENTPEHQITSMVTEKALKDGTKTLGVAIELDQTRVSHTIYIVYLLIVNDILICFIKMDKT